MPICMHFKNITATVRNLCAFAGFEIRQPERKYCPRNRALAYLSILLLGVYHLQHLASDKTGMASSTDTEVEGGIRCVFQGTIPAVDRTN